MRNNLKNTRWGVKKKETNETLNGGYNFNQAENNSRFFF